MKNKKPRKTLIIGFEVFAREVECTLVLSKCTAVVISTCSVVLRRHGVMASAAYRFSFLKGRFCFLFQLMDRHISVLKTVCRPCGKRLPSKSDIQESKRRGLKSWQVIVCCSRVTTSGLKRARSYLLPCKWKIEVRQVFCVQNKNIAVIFSKFASDPSKQKSCASCLVHMHGLYKSRSGTMAY